MSGGTEKEPYIDPQVEPLLQRMLETMAERGPMGSVSPAVMRQRFNEDVAGWNLDLPDIHKVEDFAINCDCSARIVPVRLYRPIDTDQAMPCLVFIHGGGWVVGDLETNERTLRCLALASGVSILSIDYPLAPENKFPAALDCCVSVMRWLREQGVDRGVDPDRLAIGGDSAGGNLALATALDLRNAGENWLQLALLIYPALSPNTNSLSHKLFGQGDYGLGSAAMEFFWGEYLPDKAARDDPRASPLLANLDELPPVYLVTGGLDALTDDSNSLENKLEAVGMPVMHRHYPGVVHGFFSMALFLDVGQKAVAEAATALREVLGTS
ncbi:MAG: alpha/beta hydrolase [Proteobacteria bacterium]|nr:alpha/beta hydrolase [Pseudomonadota bacterium]